MTTSGSYDFTLTRNQIITGALRKVGAVSQGNVPSAPQISETAEALNALVKSLQTRNVHLWTLEWVTKAFTTAASQVTGTDSNIYTCIKSHTSSNNATTGDTPITLPNWSTYWTLKGSTGGVWANATAYGSTGDFTVAADTLAIEKAFLLSYNLSITLSPIIA